MATTITPTVTLRDARRLGRGNVNRLKALQLYDQSLTISGRLAQAEHGNVGTVIGQLARELDRSERWVRQLRRLSEVYELDHYQHLLALGLSAGCLLVLAEVADDERRRWLLQRLLRDRLSWRQLRRLVARQGR